MPIPAPGSPATALLVTRDASLRDELTSLAAAAGTPVTCADDPGSALRGWISASAVLVGADLAGEIAASSPPRRAQVSVVSWQDPAPAVYRAAWGVGADSVVELPEGRSRLQETLGGLGEATVARGFTFGVVGGSGGAGATTFACVLGQVAAAPAAVLDLDPLGPGVDRVLGVEEMAGVGWADLVHSRGRLNAQMLRDSLPRRDGLSVLAYGAAVVEIAPAVLREVVAAVRRGHEAVVLDLPRTPGATWDEVVPRCDLVLVVVNPTVGGVASALRVIAALPDQDRVQAVIGPGGSTDPEVVERVLGVPVIAELPRSRRINEAVDLGYGPVRNRGERLARVVREIAGSVGL